MIGALRLSNSKINTCFKAAPRRRPRRSACASQHPRRHQQASTGRHLHQHPGINAPAAKPGPLGLAQARASRLQVYACTATASNPDMHHDAPRAVLVIRSARPHCPHLTPPHLAGTAAAPRAPPQQPGAQDSYATAALIAAAESYGGVGVTRSVKILINIWILISQCSESV